MTNAPHNDDASEHGPFSATRWSGLARATGFDAEVPVAVALSGGADSVYLLHVVAAARPKPRILAIHVDHELRGAESRADARFCARLCRELGVALEVRRAPLAAGQGSLEARAREARYAALARVAETNGIGIVATGHHADDALETLLLRWLRGSDLAGLAGMPARRDLLPRSRERAHRSAPRIQLVRPLLGLRREEVRAALRERGIAWREDSSNASDRFARNRVRNALLPIVAEVAGDEAIENLRAFGAAVEELEERCAAATADLCWSPPEHAAARRGEHDFDLGGWIERARLVELAPPLRRRALARLIAEGTGAMPSRALLERMLADLTAGRTSRHDLAGAWNLHLRARSLVLEPPRQREQPVRVARQHVLEFAAPARTARTLDVGGSVELGDGRSVSCRTVDGLAGALPRAGLSVDVDAATFELPLEVRFARPGDRFHPLGAPGSRRLVRFLADAGIPRADRVRVPLVVSGGRIVWVAGLRPAEDHKVTPRTAGRLRLTLHHPGLRTPTADDPAGEPADEKMQLFAAPPVAARRSHA